MRFGCCGSMVSPTTDPIGIDAAETMASLGFDYVELSLADLAALPPRAFADLAARLDRAGIPCEACNNFFPRHIRLTGNAADPAAAVDYARRALERAAFLGARIVVFGSSGAKNVPEGFSRADAWQQIVGLLRQLGPVAAGHNMVIAIEPINRLESNIVNLAAEGLRLAADVDHPNVQLLVDFYHLMMEREDPDIVIRAGSAIRHVHFAEPDGRRFPGAAEPDTSAFFDRLRRAWYTDRCSIEAYTDNFRADAARALDILRQEAGQSAAPDIHRGGGANL